MTSLSFEAALAEYTRLRDAELASPPTTDDEAALTAFDGACDRTTAAFKRMMAIPSGSPLHASQKLAATADLYDLTGAGIDPMLFQQLLNELHGALAFAQERLEQRTAA